MRRIQLLSPLAIALLAGSAAAQVNYAIPGMRTVMGGRSMNMMDQMGEEGMGFDEAEMDMMSRGGRPDGDEQPLIFKTPLGKYLQRLDYTRTPEAVLKSRAKLATDLREDARKAAHPEPKAHEPKPEAANPASGGSPVDENAAIPSEPPAPGEMPPGADEEMKFLPGENSGFTPAMAMQALEMARQMGVEPPPELLQAIEQMNAGGEAGGGNEAGAGDDAGGLSGPPGLPGRPGAKPDPKNRQANAEEKKLGDRFRLLFVAGDWPAVATFLKEQAGEDAESLYSHLLTMLQRDSAIVPGEVLAFADAAPKDLTDKHVTKLANVLKSCIRRGTDPSHVAAMIRSGTRFLGGQSPEGRARAARFLMAADLPVEAQPFLDPLEQARTDENAALINLHAMYFQGLAARKKDPLEKKAAITESWKLCLEVFGIENAKAADRTAALTRAMGFLDDVPTETGTTWLTSLFKDQSDLAWGAIETANQRARSGRMMGRQPDDRLKALRALKRIGQSLLDGAGENVETYHVALDMMSMTILEEAEDTKRRRQDERFRFIPPEQLGDVLPTAAWLRAGDPGLAAKLELQTAAVSGGSGDIAGVLDMVRPLATKDPERAGKIVEAVIAAWPNYVKPSQGGMDGYDPYGYGGGYGGGYNPYASRRYPSYYGGGYNYGGYEGATPLTRARQERFLAQLGTLLKEFAALGLPPAPSASIVAAFSASHSDSEVYVTDYIESVFGPVSGINHDTAVELADAMRKRLGGLWRKPQTQQESGAKRNDKQIAAEVLRGYVLAVNLAQRGAEADKDSWRAATLLADLSFDKAEFLYGQKADLATYSGLREAAFAGYDRATQLYLKSLEAGKAQPTARVYFQWFSSALGASDLGVLTRQDQPNESQIDRVVAAMQAIPGTQGTAHVALFAKDVNNALNTLAPELKVRFLTSAARVLGDHPDAAAARKQLAYYNDLKKEVELTLAIDGPTQVGTADPFGAVLSIHSTRAVGRDTGGFSKYLLNQQYHPQTGQPVDYKDDFEKKIRQTLSERFEVVSISFCKPGIAPIGLQRDGWEMHPLAYLLLKPKDPSVDKLPALQIDMDFSDGRGSVVLPVTSSVTLIDAKTPPPAAARLAKKIEIEQTLDDRTIAARTLKLEIRAKGQGLLPSLADLVDLATINAAGFEIVKTDDHAANISELDTSGESVVALSEHAWTLDLSPRAGTTPRVFNFPLPKVKAEKAEYKRYADADIVAVTASVPIEIPGKLPMWQVAASILAGVVILGGVVTALFRKRRVQQVYVPRFTVPAEVTPVSAIATLKHIAGMPQVSLAEGERVALITQIDDLERRYFAPAAAPGAAVDTDLTTVVRTWVNKAEAGLRN